MTIPLPKYSVKLQQGFRGSSPAQLLQKWTPDLERRIQQRKLERESEKNIWEFAPVDPVTFITGKDYLNLSVYDRKSQTGDVYQPIVEDVSAALDGWQELKPRYDVVIFDEGIGTGKSYKMGLVALYLTYILLSLRNPQKKFGLSFDSKIAIMNVSVTAKQAKDVVFDRIASKTYNSVWFRDNFPPNDDIASQLEFDPIPKRARLRAGKSHFKNIFVIPGSSSSFSAIGYDVFLAIIDEASLFKDTTRRDKTDDGESDMNQAEIIYNTLLARISSRFWAKGHPGMLMLGGSPQYQEDFLERKCAEADVNERMFVRRRPHWGVHHPTWNGKVFYVDLRNVQVIDPVRQVELEAENEIDEKRFLKVPDIEAYRKPFESRTGAAIRDLGGRATKAINRFFTMPLVLETLLNVERENPQIDAFTFKPWFGPISEAPHSIHVDLAKNQCAASLSMSHCTGLTVQNEPLTFNDLTMRFVKEDFDEGEILFEVIMNIIIFLRDHLGFDIGIVTYDGWQSTHSIQLLKFEHGFFVEEFSVDKTATPYYNLRRDMMRGRIDYYHTLREDQNSDAVPSLVDELQGLEEHLINGRAKIEKRKKTTKDMADAFCGSHNNILRYNWMQTTEKVTSDYRATVIG